MIEALKNIGFIVTERLERKDLSGKNGVDCYSKNGHAVTVLTRQS